MGPTLGLNSKVDVQHGPPSLLASSMICFIDLNSQIGNLFLESHAHKGKFRFEKIMYLLSLKVQNQERKSREESSPRGVEKSKLQAREASKEGKKIKKQKSKQIQTMSTKFKFLWKHHIGISEDSLGRLYMERLAHKLGGAISSSLFFLSPFFSPFFLGHVQGVLVLKENYCQWEVAKMMF